MLPKVFLSLSHADADFVRAVHSKLPRGLAHFYEASFNNGEKLLSAMTRAVQDADLFVLFASPAAVASPWVGFELDQARIQQIKSSKHKLLVFPTDPTFKVSDLPEWLRDYWIPKGGFLPSDVARYITNFLLAPSSSANTVVRVIGRGKTQDQLEQLCAEHLSRTKQMPTVYFLSGFRGVGRRTFAASFMRHALAPEANLAFGPTILVSGQADIQDIYLALKSEITPGIAAAEAAAEVSAFQSLEEKDQIDEILRQISHFSDLGQAVTLVSAGGFFEDSGQPKTWVLPLLNAVEAPSVLFVVSNRQLPTKTVEQSRSIVQMRVGELQDSDIRTLMTFTAQRLGLVDFAISDPLVQAIGGHADVAKAAVRLAHLKGVKILERDPAQLFNVQNLILGESIAALTEIEIAILALLSWVPKLNAELLFSTLESAGYSEEQFIIAIEGLILSCLVSPYGSSYSISPSIRLLFRRTHVTPPHLLTALSAELKKEWDSATESGEVRIDLIETIAFMYSLEGHVLPKELGSLLSPGMLSDILRDMYARGKDEANREQLERVLKWGELANSMRMTDATREEIMSTMARTAIRLGKYPEAGRIIDTMSTNGFRSVPFLRGHLYRKQERYPEAILLLSEAVGIRKFQRSAVHELALSYQRSGKATELNKLLSDHGDMMSDSAMFLDLQIGMDLAQRDLPSAAVRIQRLKHLPDDEGRSDIRSAQLLMARGYFNDAANQLSEVLKRNQGGNLKVLCLRATCHVRMGRFDLAAKDIGIVKHFASWHQAATRLEAAMLVEQRQPAKARLLLDNVNPLSPSDWMLYARALEMEAELPATSLKDRQPLRTQAAEIRLRHKYASEDDFDTDS